MAALLVVSKNRHWILCSFPQSHGEISRWHRPKNKLRAATRQSSRRLRRLEGRNRQPVRLARRRRELDDRRSLGGIEDLSEQGRLRERGDPAVQRPHQGWLKPIIRTMYAEGDTVSFLRCQWQARDGKPNARTNGWFLLPKYATGKIVNVISAFFDSAASICSGKRVKP